MISVEHIDNRIQNKAQLYDSLLRNGFMLPSAKSATVTVKYLFEVKDKAIWCPEFNDVKLRACPTPPMKRVIFEQVVQILKSENLYLGILDETKVDANWLLICLSTIDPHHEYFQKGYYPPELLTRYQRRVN
jgi:hypothetical protein